MFTERMNRMNLRQRIADRSQPPLIVSPVTLACPELVEIIGFAGGEAVMIDTEHGMMDSQTVRSMLVHAQAANMPALYRPRCFDAAACRQALDQGAAGVHVPHVDTADEAQAVVRACRYAPLGEREMSLGRAVCYNGANIGPYVDQANERVLLVVMIESLTGLDNVEAIAAVKGIDVIHLGIADLSQSMGLTGQYQHRDVNDAINRVLNAAKQHNVAVGYPTEDPQWVAHWVSRGMRFFEADTPDYLLREIYADRFISFRRTVDVSAHSPES